ncbi:CHAP domain-containing protein [Gryllotalpicola protaetiae]|uniref:CHAP domain-containing protein n=1 Tax=Gryllotalpicola protaetiae TaxID=2419771 RepID=UPI0013C4A605|nr:CHAP domain-containing protein [Gryllotalpicola protaetiae]
MSALRSPARAVVIAFAACVAAFFVQLPGAAFANGGGQTQFQPLAGVTVGDPADPPTPMGAAIATLALAQLGRGLNGPNTLDGRDFADSSALPGAWCAEFAAWTWASSGAPIGGLDGWAGSFFAYGVQHGSYHASGPRVGDAAVFALSAPVASAAASGTLAQTHAISHVGIVVAVSPTAITIVNGDWGDGRGGAQLVRLSAFTAGQSHAGDYAPGMRQYIAGYVDPVGL